MNIFKKAHEITREILREGDDYRETFRLCLQDLYNEIKIEKEIEDYTMVNVGDYDGETLELINTYIENNNITILDFFNQVDGCKFYKSINWGNEGTYKFIKYRPADDTYIIQCVRHIGNKIIKDFTMGIQRKITKGMVI